MEMVLKILQIIGICFAGLIILILILQGLSGLGELKFKKCIGIILLCVICAIFGMMFLPKEKLLDIWEIIRKYLINLFIF